MTGTALWQPVPQRTSHSAFPGLVRLWDGSWLACWRESTRHTGGTPSRIVTAVSWDGLRTWDEPRVAVDTGVDLRDPSLAVSADSGHVWLSWFSWAGPGPRDCTASVMDSDDLGVTWKPPWDVAPLPACSPLLLLPDGRQLLPTYGRSLTADTWDSCHAQLLDSEGLTIIADGQKDGRHYQEPYVIRLRSGALLAAFRYGTWDRIGLSASWDSGATWSTPVAKFPGTGRPLLIELATGPTICVYRQPATRAAVWRESPDRGGSWGPERLLATAGAQMVYAAAVEMRPGVVGGLVGLEASDTSSRLMSWFLDGAAS